MWVPIIPSKRSCTWISRHTQGNVYNENASRTRGARNALPLTTARERATVRHRPDLIPHPTAAHYLCVRRCGYYPTRPEKPIHVRYLGSDAPPTPQPRQLPADPVAPSHGQLTWRDSGRFTTHIKREPDVEKDKPNFHRLVSYQYGNPDRHHE